MQPTWGKSDDKLSPFLPEFLEFARAQYAQHTDWFLRHRDAGITALAGVLGAEVGIAACLDKVHLLVAAVSVVLAVLGLLLAQLATLSCTRAFSAALEHAAFAAKIVWAMGVAKTVNVSPCANDTLTPLRNDPMFYVPRYLRDASCYETTDAYVQAHLRKAGTSYCAAKRILWVMGGCAAALGFGTAIAAAVT